MTWTAGITETIRRALALVAALVILAGPARAFLQLDGVPLALRLAWPLACAAFVFAPRASLFLFLGAVPLLGVVPDVFRLPPVSLGELWLHALLVGAALRVLFGRLPRATAFPRSAIVLFVVATASLVVTLYPYQLARDGIAPLLRDLATFWQTDLIVAISQRHLYASIVAWLTLIEGLALIWLMLTVLRDAADVMRALTNIAIGGVCVAAIGLAQWWTGARLLSKWVLFDPYITRINATFTDVNAAGAFFALLIVPLWVLSQLAKTRQARRGWWVGVGVMAVGLLFTGSRAAWASALIAAVLYGFADRVREGSPDQAWHVRCRRPLALVVGAVLVLASLSIYATIRDVRHREQRSYLHTVLYTLNMRMPMDERLKGRFAFWRAGWDMVRDHPWDGVGVGRYYKLMPNYLEAAGVPVVQENAHNYFLQVAAELGVTGLVALLALYGSALAAGWRAWQHGADVRVRRLALGLSAGVLAFLLTCVTGHSLLLHEGQLTFVPLLALLFVLARQVGGGAAGVAASAWSGRAAMLATWAIVLAVCASVPYRAQAAINAVDLSGQSNGVHEVEYARDGTPFRWTNPHAVLYLPDEWRSLSLPLRSVAPTPQTVIISLGERRIDQVTLTDHAWHIVTYALPVLKAGERFHRLDISVTPAFTPPGADQRELGVMLGDYGAGGRP